MNKEKIEQATIQLIEGIGEDFTREGLQETPKRVAKAWSKLTEGYKIKVEDILTVFDSGGYDQMVLLKDIEFYSQCEHHLLPFYGKVHVAYIPNKKIVGISKLARIVDIFARRLQNQERLTEQVVEAIEEHLSPLGVAVKIEASHFCMRARGIQKQNSVMITNKLTGVFIKKPEARQEFFNSL